MQLLSSLPPVLLSLALFACAGDSGPFELEFGQSSPGQRTDIRYSWSDFNACGFGCSLNSPLVTGSAARIHLDVPSGSLGSRSIAAVEVASGDAAIEMVGFEMNISGNSVDRYLELRGVSPGYADLDLFAEDGSLIDTIGVSVADVSEVALKPDITEATIAVGDSTTLWIELFDEQERNMVGYPPLTWTVVGGEDFVSLRNSPSSELPNTSNFAQLEALAEGTSTVLVETPGGVFTDIEIEVE
jgi:hypothetical protein